jgi:RNA polymerase sigma-70 factor (ECF subfamily)
MRIDCAREMTFLNEDTRKKIDELFRRYGRGVGSYVLLRVGSPELAEEITARVFLAVVRSIHQQNGSLIGWLWAIVRSELARHYRERPHQTYPANLTSAATPPLELLEHRERDELLHAALRRMSDEEQQLLSLKFFMGLPNIEIAQATGLTATNVGVKIHRCLKNLRVLLQSTLSLDPTETV